MTDPFTPKMDLKVRESRDRQLAGRAIPGAPVYPLVFAIIAYRTGLSELEPDLTTTLLGILVALTLLRVGACLSFPVVYRRHPTAWRSCFVFSVTGLGLAWGLIAAYSMYYYPWTPGTLLFLFSGSGLAGGMIGTIAIDGVIYRIYLLALLVPPGLTAALSEQPYGDILSTFHLLYFSFLWIQGRRQSDAFLESVRQTVQITAQRDLLVEAKKNAEKASLAKSHLLANVSHELRTPMNTIVGTTEWALAKPGESPDRELWHEVHNAGLHLLSVINQVLDFSKIDSGVISDARCEPFRLAHTVDQVGRLFARVAEAKGLELRILNPLEAQLTLLGDEGRFRQVLCNLVGNAIKFTDEGAVTIRIAHNQKRLVVEVEDSGAGIPTEHLERIFEPFAQADTTIARRHGGTGLGLTISRELAHSMDGTLELRSEIGRGTIFTLSIPAPVTTLEAVQRSSSTDFSRDYTVLVVDDDLTNLRVARRQLVHLGMTVEVARSGPEALEKCSEKKFDLILMDLQMPHVDGFSVTSKLKGSQPGLNADTPIVAFTAHTGEQERERCREVGMVAFLNKPLQRCVLAAELEALEARGVLAPRT